MFGRKGQRDWQTRQAIAAWADFYRGRVLFTSSQSALRESFLSFLSGCSGCQLVQALQGQNRKVWNGRKVRYKGSVTLLPLVVQVYGLWIVWVELCFTCAPVHTHWLAVVTQTVNYHQHLVLSKDPSLWRCRFILCNRADTLTFIYSRAQKFT